MAKYSLEPDGVPASSIDLAHVTAHQWAYVQEETVLKLLGRGNKVDRGTDYGREGSLTATLRATSTQTVDQQFNDIDTLRAPGCDAIRIRDPFGHDWKASITGLSASAVAAGGDEYLNMILNYVEVA